MNDPILFWNAVALEANRRDFTDIPPGATTPMPEQGGPTLSSRALAIVHLAMYDAYAAIVNRPDLPRYLTDPGRPVPAPGADATAAVAVAAHDCLSALFPRQVPDFAAALAGAGVSGMDPSSTDGRDFGTLVAQALLNDRQLDPSASDAGYVPLPRPGSHRSDPTNPGQNFHAPFYGARSKGFAITRRHELDPPPQPGNDEYLQSLRQVRAKGIAPELEASLPADSEPRTPGETIVGLFWAYDGARNLGTPPRLYNQIVRAVAIARGNDVAQNARLFALVNAAMGDAGILAWDQKYIHDLWRPVLGIREHDVSMGPGAAIAVDQLDPDCDPEWVPLGAPASNSPLSNFTPNFPAYPSGHATFGGAALHMVRLFYGVAPGNRSADRRIYDGPFVSEELNGITRNNRGHVRARHLRSFPEGLWQMIVENGFSRIFLGVHWSFDAFALDDEGEPDLSRNIGGVPLGLAIAEDIFTAGLGRGPVKSTVPPRL